MFKLPNEDLLIEMWAVERMQPYGRNPQDNDGAEDRLLEALRTCEFKISVRAVLAAAGRMMPHFEAGRTSAGDESVEGE
jgi:hypothetical protein